MKKLISLLLAVLLLAALGACAYADTGLGIEPGDAMPDFTVELTDGTTATLSELLKDKSLVVLNIFASWCVPCEKEFPHMEEIYRANSDRMVIVSVSGDPEDTMEMIADYKESHGLSFPMGLAGDALSFIHYSSFPTTVLINRDGNIGLIKVGAFTSREEFETLVDAFLAADYDGANMGFQKAFNLLPYLLGLMLLSGVLVTIGRWCLLRKAGRTGWHSLIPLLSTYKEYSLCWNGWLGVLDDLCFVLALVSDLLKFPSAVYYALMLLNLGIGVAEGLKLAKVFGKGKVFGVLMALPVFKTLLRFVLGVSKAPYQPED